MSLKCLSCTIWVGGRPTGSAPGGSAALAETRDGAGYEYEFSDDALHSDVIGSSGTKILGTIPPKRVLLIRPRTAFVLELFESAEDL